jgi:hypothetical protein
VRGADGHHPDYQSDQLSSDRSPLGIEWPTVMDLHSTRQSLHTPTSRRKSLPLSNATLGDGPGLGAWGACERKNGAGPGGFRGRSLIPADSINLMPTIRSAVYCERLRKVPQRTGARFLIARRRPVTRRVTTRQASCPARGAGHQGALSALRAHRSFLHRLVSKMHGSLWSGVDQHCLELMAETADQEARVLRRDMAAE